METIQISAAGATTKKKAAGEVQEKPAAARGGVVDADCQRVSDASALPPGDWHQPPGECQAALWPSVAPSGRKRSEPATRVPWLPARSDG